MIEVTACASTGSAVSTTGEVEDDGTLSVSTSDGDVIEISHAVAGTDLVATVVRIDDALAAFYKKVEEARVAAVTSAAAAGNDAATATTAATAAIVAAKASTVEAPRCSTHQQLTRRPRRPVKLVQSPAATLPQWQCVRMTAHHRGSLPASSR